MKKYLKILNILFAMILICLIPAFAHAQDIGGGYTCTDSKIYKKNKEVKLSKAKSAIQDKIDAVKGNSQKAKSKKSELKTIKSNLTSCTKGTFNGGGETGGGGDELTGSIDDFINSLVARQYIGGYTVGGVKYYLVIDTSRSTGKTSINLKSDGLFVGKAFLTFEFEPEYHTPLPATTAATVRTSFFGESAYTGNLGSVTMSVRRFKGKFHDEYELVIKNDLIPVENRVRADIAKFIFTMKSSQSDFYKAIKFEGTFNALNDSDQVVATGPISATYAD